MGLTIDFFSSDDCSEFGGLFNKTDTSTPADDDGKR